MIENTPINEQIKAHKIILIDEDGKNLGEKSKFDSISIARSKGLDLIQVSSSGNVPICKVADYGKMKYKHDKAEKKHQHAPEMKETRFHIETQQRDIDIKMRQVSEWLKKGHKVKITVKVEGRNDNFQSRMEMACEKLSTLNVDKIANCTVSEIKKNEKDVFVMVHPILEHQDKKCEK